MRKKKFPPIILVEPSVWAAFCKQGRQSVIVDRIGYDKEDHTVYTKLGNGTETTYTYDKQRERLQVMNLTADGQTVMENRYRYDAVDNILGITNAANPASLTKLNKKKLGGVCIRTIYKRFNGVYVVRH